MKFVTNLFRAKPASLEEGTAKYRSTNEYYVLHRDKSRTRCGRLVQTVKVILYIELIILIGWLGCVSFSYFGIDRNTDCRVSAVGCKASQVDYDDIEVKNSRGSRSVEDTDDGQQMCQTNADVTRRSLESLAAQFVTGEPSDTTVDPLRRDFIKLTVFESLRALARLSAAGGSVKGSTDDAATTTTSLFGSIPNWQEFMEEMSEKFNSTDSQDRQRLEARVVPTAELTSQLVAITESFYVDVRYCNRLLLNALVSDRELHRSDEDTPRLRRESEPVNQSKPIPEPITAMCWNEEEEDRVLLEERRARQEIFATRSGLGYEYEQRTQQMFLKGIEKALNATSTSEIQFDEELMENTMVIPSIQYLVRNAPLKLQKEGYELARDLFMEMHGLNHRGSEWEGWIQDAIAKNLTNAIFFSKLNMTSQSIFDNFVRFGEAFNLHYEKPKNRSSGNAPYGKFINLGREPEMLGVRHLRHTLDNFVRLYYKIQNPSSPGMCTTTVQTRAERSIEKRFVTETPIWKSATLNCWSKEQDDVLLEERRARLENYRNKELKNNTDARFTQMYMEGLAAALNATQTTDIHFDEMLVETTPILRFMNFLLTNSSLELHKEGYEIIRDMWLEMLELKTHSSDWDGYNEQSINENMTALGIPRNVEMNSESIFHGIVKFGIPFNLRYQELANRDSGDEPGKPVFGKLVYVGDEPEKLGVRRLRHLLDGFVKLYFKIQDPSTSMVCNLTVKSSGEGGKDETPTRDERSVEKRAVTPDPVPQSTTTKCWSEEEDKILEEERLERLAAYALRTNKKVLDTAYTKAYLEGIEAALNATSISEIHFEDDNHKSVLLMYTESLSENSSLDIRKEGYEINRDLHLEMFELKNHSPEWDGYDLDRIFENISATPFDVGNARKEAMFNDLITFGNAFSLRYEELGKRESGDESNKPVFGKFTYRGEEPEKPGVRQLGHILDAFTKFYFKTQEPSSVCKSGTPTTDPAPEPTNGNCWDMEQDPALLQERRQRLEAYALWNEGYEAKMFFSKNYMDTLGEALSASSTSEIHFNETWLKSTPLLAFVQDLAMNSSLELCKELLEINRDLWLEIDALEDHTSEWEGYDLKTIQKNLTDNSKSDGSTLTLETMFDDLKKFGRPFNLRYEEIQNGDSEDKTDKPVIGKFTYIGEEPEAAGVRNMRHILDGFARFYFKVRHPSIAPVCKSTSQTHAKESVKKRDVTPDPVPESITTKCWSEEQDKILEEERLERLAAYAFRTNKKMLDTAYTKAYLAGIEAALNATSISEIHFEDKNHKSVLLMYTESLSENSSLDIRKEGYEINRDLHLEMSELKNHSPEWDGYDLDRIFENITASPLYVGNASKEAMFNDLITFGNAFSLRYEELGKRESGDESNKPVFGKFTYRGEEPEKPGVRQLGHILDAFTKFYFKTQEPSSVCKSGTPTTDPAPEPTNGNCWDMEQDPALLQERRQRLEAYALWNEGYEAKMFFSKNYMDTLGEALSASSTSEIHFNETWLKSTPLLAFVQDLAMNSSLELCKELLEINRDLWLEIDALEDHTSEWEGYDLKTIQKNLTDNTKSDGSTLTLETMFDDLKKFGRPFNLRYEEIRNGDSGDKTDKPVIGKFTYIGEEPEAAGVRNMRHILDGFARFYFKVRHPSIAPVCKSTSQTHAKESVKKRDVTPDPVPESTTTKCWSEEEDKILEEERLERLAAYAFRTDKKVLDTAYTKAYLEGIEAALNATSISEIHFEDKNHKSVLLMYTESLSENSSLDIRKEGYEINRDLHLEMSELKNHSPEWDGYDLDRIFENITASPLYVGNASKEAMFNDLITFGNAFSLRYEELGKRESGDESNKPVFGKFTYRGEEPEKPGVRQLGHILDAFTKFYFKTQEPSSVCKSGTPTTDPAPEPTNGNCWDMEQDPALLQERRQRLEAYALWYEGYEAKMFFSKNYMDTLGEALSASSTSEIHFNETWLKSTPLLAFVQDLAMNSSLELCKELLEINRDLWLEIDALEGHTSEWEGYDLNTIQNNLTDTSKSGGSTLTLETMFDDLKKFGRPFNLRYEEIRNGDSEDKTDKPVIGKFTYIGEEPEAAGVRNMRHILDGFARFYFKVRHPSIAPVCKSTSQTHAKESVKKRDVTPDPVPESITTKCWSEEQDKILEEERLERLAAFAFRTSRKMMDQTDAKAYFEGIEAALNATSISEIHFDENIRKSPLLTYMESLCENSSLDIRKEGYEINRDLHLELYELRNHNPEWDGYDIDLIYGNLTGSQIFSINMTKEANFNDIIIFSNAFNLRYEELGNRESGDVPNKPVFGKFTYIGEEPEKAGVRHLRHILDAFAKFYFKTQEPSLVCNGGTPTTDPVPEPTNGKCWNMEQDPALLEERRERLEAYTAWNSKTEAKMLFTKTYMDTLGKGLSASSTSEIHFDEKWLKSAPLLATVQDLAKNSSLELCKEALEIARDLWLEIDALEDHSPEWKGYDLNTIGNNLTDTSDSDSLPTLEIMFDDLKKFGRPLNLRYEEIEKGDSGDKTDNPVLGKFTYIGEEPETMGVRHMRHILDGFARFYFKVRHPSIAPECKSTAKTHLVKKRDVTPDPVPETITTKCWSEEQDKVLEEERLDRLAAFAFRTSRKMLDATYSKAFLEGIEGALNATSISEINFDDNLPKSPLLTYMESLCENSSLEIRKEGYEINRDLHLEMYELKNHSPEWEGYDLKRIHDNLTASDLFAANATKEGIFNDIVTFSNAFNLRYEELGNRESGDEPNKPVFGRFTYGGEEPEKLGIRQLKYILNAFVKFYFKTQEPSSVCKSGTPTTDAVPEATNGKCWNMDQDPALLEERRARLEAYARWNEKREDKMLFTKNYLDTLGEALNAKNASEIHIEDRWSKTAPILAFIQDLAKNSSLELCKELLEIARDLWLELDALEDHAPEWEGYDFDTVQNNLTDTSRSDDSALTLETMFDDLKKLGRPFNLSYEETENGDNEDKAAKPVLGKFTYIGEQPEAVGVRHMRHILDGFARFSFKVRHPSIAPLCNSSGGGGENINTR